MTKYEYLKTLRMFTKNGHTMFNEDVLTDLNKLDLSEEWKKKYNQLLLLFKSMKCKCGHYFFEHGQKRFFSNDKYECGINECNCKGFALVATGEQEKKQLN